MAYPNNEPDDATVPGETLLDLVEAFEKLDIDKRELAGQQKEVMASVKESGFDAKVFRKLIALRKRDPDDVAGEAETLEIYKSALGMT